MAGLPLLLLCLSLFFLASGRISAERVWNWDLIAYMGSVHEFNGLSAVENHAATFAELERSAPPDAFEQLTSGDSAPGDQQQYRQTVFASPEAFEAQLGFYRGRWIYICLLDFLQDTSVSLTENVYGVSRLAGAALLILIMLWLAQSMPLLPAAVLAWGGMELTHGFETAATAGPDSLATLLLLGGTYALTQSRSPWLAGPLLLAAVGTRVDHVVFVVPLLLWAASHGFGERRKLSGAGLALLLVLCAVVIYGCTAAQNTYDWWTVHCHTFQRYMPLPSEQTPPQDLVAGLLYSARSLPKFTGTLGLVFCLVPIAGLWLARRAGSDERARGLCVVALVGLFAHFALFPVLWPRLMAPYWLLGWVGLTSQFWLRKLAAQG